MCLRVCKRWGKCYAFYKKLVSIPEWSSQLTPHSQTQTQKQQGVCRGDETRHELQMTLNTELLASDK